MADDDVSAAFDYLGKRQPLTPPKLALTSSGGGGGPVTAPVTPQASPAIGTSSPSTGSGGPSGAASRSAGGSSGLAQAQELLGLAKQGLRFIPQTGMMDFASPESSAAGVFAPGQGQTGAVGGPVAGPEGIEGAVSVPGESFLDSFPFADVLSGLLSLPGGIGVLTSNADDGTKAAEAIKLIANFALPSGVGFVAGGFIDAIVHGLTHEGGYIPHRTDAIEQIKQVPDQFAGLLEQPNRAARDAFLNKLSTDLQQKGYRIRFDPKTYTYSGGYESGDQAWSTINPQMQQIIKIQNAAYDAAERGDPSAPKLLALLAQQGQALTARQHPPETPDQARIREYQEANPAAGSPSSP